MPDQQNDKMSEKPMWVQQMRIIIFGTDTFWGRTFDIVLLIAILLSVIAVMLESVGSIEENHGTLLRTIEWIFTIVFSMEYIARLISSDKPFKYIFSFFGLVDLLSIIPTFLSLFILGPQYLLTIRTFRLLRVFRILKLVRFIGEAKVLGEAVMASRYKITVFLITVLAVAVITGSMMYIIEGPEHGYTSIPRGIYWAIVTLTTVGFGDIAPHTVLGQALASVLMILGYGVIAVPTGIIGAEVAQHLPKKNGNHQCPGCKSTDHDDDANYCKHCGTDLSS